jgi:WD40 repeat protein
LAQDPAIARGTELRVLSPDGSLLATSDTSGKITISKYENGQYTEISTFVKEQAASLAFHPEGRILAVGTARNVSLVDIASGNEIARIPHSDAVNGVSFSSDGNYLATASSRVLQIWDATKIHAINSDDLVQTACSRLIQNLDTDQWTTLFENEKYRTLCDNLPVPQ